MRYFVTAIREDREDLLCDEFEAPSFEAAAAETITRAKRQFGGERYRITSITEQPRPRLARDDERNHFQVLREANIDQGNRVALNP